MKHTSGSPSAWKARREAYRKTQGPASNPGDGRARKRARRLILRGARRLMLNALARDAAEAIAYRQSIHCGCGQCLPGEDRQCPARSYLDPEEL